ncbi:MAG: outer membrane lipoprotein carrier protein LolA [Nitrospirae bacterium]|nr:outer membrane lipoprotein carrier protein LolA [Nitrospirota bacterium]
MRRQSGVRSQEIRSYEDEKKISSFPSLKFLTSQFLKFVLFLFTVCCSLFTFASAATVDEITASLQKKYGEINDVSGKFSQKSYIKDLEKTEKYEGRFFISMRPVMKMKWIYTSPRDEEVFINGADIWMYKRSEKQALKGKFGKDAYGQVPMALLNSIGDLKANFDITVLKDDTLELKPKQQMGFIKKIHLVTDTKEFPVKSFTMFDVYGNRIEISVKDAQINSGLGEQVFIFKAPSGVEVFEFNP